MAKITQKEYDQMHAQYARMEAYDQWTTPFNEDNTITVDKDYEFQPKTRAFKAEIGRASCRERVSWTV